MSTSDVSGISKVKVMSVASPTTGSSEGNSTAGSPAQEAMDKSEAQLLVSAAIKDGLASVLGDGAARAVLFHIGLDQFAKYPRTFDENLRVIFQDGAVVLEKVIVKTLWANMGASYQEAEPFDFETALGEALRRGASGGGDLR